METLDLTTLDDAALAILVDEIRARERGVRAEMRPFEERLSAIRSELELALTEQRRRDRQARHQTRVWVRTNVRGQEFPSLDETLAAGAGVGDAELLGARRYFLQTGGEVALGYAGSSKAGLAFTDGGSSSTAADFGEARRLYSQGWELGTPQKLGVRVHFVGTRQEKLVAGDEVFVGPAR
jgi:hypothetical protein